MQCDICETQLPVVEDGGFSIDDLTCPGCGQVYEYEEGYQIVLTQEQINLLKAHQKPPDHLTEIVEALKGTEDDEEA